MEPGSQIILSGWTHNVHRGFCWSGLLYQFLCRPCRENRTQGVVNELNSRIVRETDHAVFATAQAGRADVRSAGRFQK